MLKIISQDKRQIYLTSCIEWGTFTSSFSSLQRDRLNQMENREAEEISPMILKNLWSPKKALDNTKSTPIYFSVQYSKDFSPQSLHERLCIPGS